MITFNCPCGKQLAAKEEHAGKQTVCPTCGKQLLIPASSGPATPAGDDDARRESPLRRELGTPRRDDRDDDVAEDAPRRRPRDDDDEDDRERPRQRRYEDDDDEDDDRGPRRRRHSSSTGETSGAAVTALVAGIISFLCPLVIPNLVAIIAGIMGLVAAGQGKKGKGMAIAGLVLGAVTLLCIPINLALLLPAIQKVREAASSAQSLNNLKQIGIAMHSHNDAYKSLPQAAIFDEQTGQPLLSWRVKILPFIEQQHLFEQFNLKEPWDSPHNIRLLNQMPKVYQHPSSSADQKSMTHYQTFVGPDAMFRLDSKFRLHVAAIHDGSSNTIMVVESTTPVEWTRPDDLPMPAPGMMPALGIHGSSFNVLMADGGVYRKDARRISPETMRLAITINDGRAMPPDWTAP